VASFSGERVRFQDTRLGPSPRTRPRPPVWMGSWSPAGVRRAARWCDGWIADPIRTVAEVREMAARYRSAVPPDTERGTVVVMREAWVDDDEHVARRNFAQVIEPVFGYYRRRGALDEDHADFDSLAADRFVLGDAEQCAAGVAEVARETGADLVVLHLRHPGGPGHPEVLARIRALGAALAARAPAGAGAG
jgi:alkanesulfonate monooxygenase SsuD/methylene tetrahydromethanopterin reductase-like flavin-dependent oxidoreductase (luciferase family)